MAKHIKGCKGTPRGPDTGASARLMSNLMYTSNATVPLERWESPSSRPVALLTLLGARVVVRGEGSDVRGWRAGS